MKEGWTYKKLGEIALDMYRGSGIKRDQVTKEGVPCVRYGEIYTTYNYAFDECASHTNEECITSPKYLSHGDLLFAITGESVEDIGKTIAYLGNDKCLLGGDIVCMKHEQNPKYLAYALSSRDAIRQKGYGKTKLKVVHTSIPALSEIKIPIAPLDEQQRIVERLDSAFENIDKLKANAEKQLSEARILFQNGLAKALEPKEEWEEKKLGDVAEVFSGYAFKSSVFQKEGKYQVLRIGNIKQNYLRLSDNAIFIDELDSGVLNKSLLKEGDLVVTQTGTRHKRDYGFVALVEKDNLLLNQRNACIRFGNKLSAQFFLYYSYTDLYKDSFFANEGGTVGQGNVGLGALKEMVYYTPSLAVQQRIVERLDSLSENVRKYEEIQRQIISECDALKQALLRKVFE